MCARRAAPSAGPRARDAASPALQRGCCGQVCASLGFSLGLQTSLQRGEDILSCPGPCSAGTVARQPVSLCILARTRALLSGRGCSGLSPLPIVKQLPSWPYHRARGSLSCSAALKRRGVGQGAAGHLPFGAPRAHEDLGGFKGCIWKNRNPPRGAGGGGTRPGGC